MKDNFYFVLCIISVALLFLCILCMVFVLSAMRKKYQVLKESYNTLEKFNNKLREDRHDFFNHLQVVYGLVELNEYVEVGEYLKPVYRQYMQTSKAIKTRKPAINALVYAKMAEATGNEIDFRTEVKSDLSNIPLEDWELCKVLSNLIDNGIRVLLSDTEKEHKELVVDINEDQENYIFNISNNGPMIEEKDLNHIFERGFSTQSESGHGVGLTIVKEIVDSCKGEINVRSNPKETNFEIRLSKKGVE